MTAVLKMKWPYSNQFANCWRFSQCFYGVCRGGHFLFTKNTADDIGSFTAVCVVGVLGALNCEYWQTFVFAMCGIVTFLM